MNITINEKAREAMDTAGVLEEDVKEVVEYAESVQKLYDEENGLNLGRKRLETMSVYAEYSVSGDTAEVSNVYKHRVTMQEDL